MKSTAILLPCRAGGLKSVADKLRTKTGEDGDGALPVDAACSLKPSLRMAFNLATEWSVRNRQT